MVELNQTFGDWERKMREREPCLVSLVLERERERERERVVGWGKREKGLGIILV